MADTRLQVVIDAKNNADKAFKQLSGSLSDLGDRLRSDIVAGTMVAGAAIIGLGVSSVKAFMEAQDTITQTNAVLKSTGGIAGVTAEQVTELANAFQKTTKFEDETVRRGENLLLTFTKISKDIFPQAVEVMLDMSQALGQDVKESAIQLGKALQDPILGVTALRRVGVNFNEESKKTIENFIATNDLASAQAFILKELQTEFGGAATAAGETFSGKLTQLKNALGDLQEQIGMTILNGLQPLIQRALEWAQSEQAVQLTQRLTDAFINFANQLVIVIQYLNEHRTVAYALGFLLLSLAATMGTVGAALGLVITAGYAVYRMWREMIGAVMDIKNLITTFFQSSRTEAIRWADVLIGQMNRVVNAFNNSAPGQALGRIRGFMGFQTGGQMPYTGMAYLHKGERVLPAGTFTGGGKERPIVINIYGGIINKEGWSIDELQKQLGKAVQLAKMGV